MGKNPAFLFYPNDWANDPQLKMAPPATRGIWMDLICAMWWTPIRGVVTGSMEDLCRLGNCSLEEMGRFLDDAQRLHFADVTFGNNQVTVSNRRMVREQKVRELTRSRVQRFRNKSCNASVTSTLPVPVTVPVPVPVQRPPQTLGPAVDKTTAWDPALEEVRQFLVSIEAPDCFFKESYWLRIDQWMSSTNVYYFRELKAYLAHQASKNGHGRGKHKDQLAGFRNWLATAARWRERDAQRQAIQQRELGRTH